MSTAKIPKHVAIIMDGNGRWARQKKMPRATGHKAGAKAVLKLVENCVKKKIEVLTLFAFSSENWSRPAGEVSFLMDLFISLLQYEINKLHKQNIQLHIIGERLRFEEKLRNQISLAEKLTANNTGLKLVIAANYGGRWDITESLRNLAKQVEEGVISSEAISVDLIQAHLTLAKFPLPELLIRTSGEQRVSNFLLWQIPHTKLYFTDIFWPDFDRNALEKAFGFFASG